MAEVCQSCGGVLGRDCFNPAECAQITIAMEAEALDAVAMELHAQRDHYKAQRDQLLAAVEEHQEKWDGDLEQRPIRNEALAAVWDDDQKLYAVANSIREGELNA